MKNYLLTFMLLVMCAATLQAQDTDQTLSPYFFVKSDNPEVDQLPLKSTGAKVNIRGVIADVTIEQVYVNAGTNPIEATYVFPASTRAAVYSMEFLIGDRRVKAKIAEKQKAREQYEQAKKEGKTASLLEQNRPNVFSMNVANILPGDTIQLTLKYTEMIVPEEGVYEFVYPTVVGPRYSETPDSPENTNEKWAQTPYSEAGEQPFYAFDIGVLLETPVAVHQVESPSHKLKVRYEGQQAMNIALDDSERRGGNRDFVLRYRMKDKQIASGILLQEGEEENYFVMIMQPPQKPKVKDIPPREYIFVVDVSGSMHGFPLNTSKKLMQDLLGKVRPEDKFNVILFSYGSSMCFPESRPATKENLEVALHLLSQRQGSGGTRLYQALEKGLAQPKEENTSRSFVVITDGYVTVDGEVFDLIRKNLGEANLFAFGIGSSVNRHIIEGMAHAGMGEPFVVLHEEEAGKQADRFRQYIEQPVLTRVKVDFEGLTAYDVEPKFIPDLMAERPLIITGKYHKKEKNKAIFVNGKNGGGTYTARLSLDEAKTVSDRSLEYYWARKRIQELSDYKEYRPGNELKEEVTALGLKHSLMTAYTSFIAIDEKVRRVDGELVSVSQPLPLPEGVPNSAVRARQNAARLYKQERRSLSQSRKAVPNEEVVEEELDIELDVEEEIDCYGPVKEEEVDEDMVFTPEQQPEYPGGMKVFYKYIKENIIYPEEAKRLGISGRVFVQFVVDTDGSVTDVIVIKGIGAGCDEEAKRLVEESIKWKPGMQRGKPVKVRMVIPIVFAL